MRAHSLAGGVGVPPRVAAQGAVDAGEAVTPDARGQADDGRAGVADGCQPGSQAARRDAALGRVVVEQGADRVQEAGMLRRSQREGRGRARPRLGEDAASEDATVGEQVTQIMDGGRRSRSVGVERGRARRRLGEELNVDDGEGGAGNDGAASNSQAAGPRAERAPNKPRSVAARIVKVLGADCGLDPSTKMLSKVSAWMETSPLVLRIYGELYCPPHSWDDLAGAAKLWTGSQVRVLEGEPWQKLRRQFNVPSSMSMGEAVERIVAESARRNAMYQRNVRALHRVVEQIESRARDFLTIRERMREAQLAFLQRSCNLPVVAMFSSASVAASSVRDIVCGLDWERIRVHYDVIVRAQAVGILGTSRRAVLDSHFYSSSPPNLDVSALVVAIASYGSQQSAGGGVGQASDLIVGLSGLAVGSDLSQLQRDGIVDVNEYCRRCCPELGCKWVQVTGTLRPAGSPLSNEALKRALQETREFQRCDFEQFKVVGLSASSFIRAIRLNRSHLL